MGQSDVLMEHKGTAVDMSEPGDWTGNSVQHDAASLPRDGVAVGELLAVLDAGRTPIIAIHPDDDAGVRGRSTIDLSGNDIGQRVVVVFEQGDSSCPIVIGILRVERTTGPADFLGGVDVSADGARMIVTAQRELVLRCGKSSITLRRDGTVQIDGERIVSRAKGANRVQGGSVQLN